MKQLFPAGIQENSVQALWVKRHTKTKIIYIIILFVLIASLSILPFIFVEVSVQSRGTVRTVNEDNVIHSAIYAEIAQINIFENKLVRAGDTLIWLRTDELDEQIGRLEEKQAENVIFIKDLDNLSANFNHISSPKYQSELTQFRARLAELDISLQQSLTEYETSKKLYEKGVEAQFEHLQAGSKYKSAKSQKELARQQQINNWQAERTRLEYENRDHHSQLQQLVKRKKQYVITAPVSGNIVQYNGIQAGNFIQTGKAIAQISVSDTLMIECYISPADIGYIIKGQKIQVQVDTYNYQQWGMLVGEVREVLPDVIEVGNMSYFRVRCVMNRNYLELANGYRGYLMDRVLSCD